MPCHYQLWVVETIHWCARCGRETRHKVSSGHLAHCLEHEHKVNDKGESKAQEVKRLKREKEENNPKLF